MDTKLSGYLLLASGLALIIFSLVSVYLVFTAQHQAPQLFNQAGISFDLGKMLTGNLSQLSASGSSTEILSADTINRSTNLFVYLVFMSFVSGAGFKIATLGIQLLRPIEVHLQSTVTKTDPPRTV